MDEGKENIGDRFSYVPTLLVLWSWYDLHCFLYGWDWVRPRSFSSLLLLLLYLLLQSAIVVKSPKEKGKRIILVYYCYFCYSWSIFRINGHINLFWVEVCTSLLIPLLYTFTLLLSEMKNNEWLKLGEWLTCPELSTYIIQTTKDTLWLPGHPNVTQNKTKKFRLLFRQNTRQLFGISDTTTTNCIYRKGMEKFLVTTFKIRMNVILKEGNVRYKRKTQVHTLNKMKKKEKPTEK